MVCERCNEEVEEGRVYCPKCGFEFHYVSEYNEIDEELDKNVLNLDDVKSNKKTDNDDEWEEFHLESEMTPKEKQIRTIAKIVGMSVVIVVLLIGIIVFFVMKSRNNSFNFQLEKAHEYASSENFSKAVISYENAVNSSKNKKQLSKAAKELGLYYADNSDTKNAVYYLEMAIENGDNSSETIKTIVGLYELQGNSDAIKKLAKTAVTDETYSLFEKYLLNQPIFNYKSGTYNEYLTVEITSDDNEAIYYTLDDSPATTESMLYEAPIEVKDGTTVIHAITVNANNLVSEEIVTTYVIQSAGSIKPEIYPESGEYTDFTKVTIDDISANCKIYYTTDGTDPTEKSTEYTQSFEMPVGNHVIKAISINTVTGVKSDIVSKVYSLDISSKYDSSKAIQIIMGELERRGMVLNTSGALSDGTSLILQFEEEVTIGGQNYYIMRKYNSVLGQQFDMNEFFAVNLSTSDVFAAIKVKDGIYNLDVF